MKKFNIYTHFLFILTLVIFAGCARINQKRGDYYHDNFAYAHAGKLYQKSLSQKSNKEVEGNLADSYRKVSKPADGNAVCVGPPDSTLPACELLIVQNLMEEENYDEARQWLNDYISITPDDRVANNRLIGCDSSIAWKQDSALVVMQLLSGKINSPGVSNFSPSFYDGGIAFVSERKFDFWNGKAEWTGRNYLDLYVSKHSNHSDWSTPEQMKGKINGAFYEGPMTFSHREDTVWFTRTNLDHNKLLTNDEDINNLELYYSVKIGDKWNKPKSFEHDNSDYSIGHPSLSYDGRTLFVVSDMPGGYGGTDLYFCTSLGNGKWSKPENLGETVNTPGNEMFPFYANDKVLYFASNGQPTMGGLDIFSTRKSNKGWETPVNLKYPINTVHDDFSFIINSKDSTGYLSSNRDNWDGIDKIYGFKIKAPKPLKPPTIDGKVISRQTRAPIANAIVEFFDKNGNLVRKLTSGNDGQFTYQNDFPNDYSLIGNKEGYTPGILKIGKDDKVQSVTLELDNAAPKPQMVNGIVISKQTHTPIPFANIGLSDENGILVKKIVAGIDGHFTYPADFEHNYKISATKEGFFFSTMAIGQEASGIFITLELDSLVIGKAIVIDNILYDLDKSDIRPDAAITLDNVVSVMNENPKIRVELSSHTDCRADNNYNQALSERRAAAAVNFLIKQGIAGNRMTAKGYGESTLINRCSDGVICSEEEHQLNRRTEFKVTSMDK